MSVQSFLLKIGFLDLNDSRMQQFIDQSDHKMIRWAFDNGRYHCRKIAVEYFSSHQSNDSLEVLRRGIDDEVEDISQMAMSGLENLEISTEIKQQIEAKREYWKQENAYREGRRNREHRKTSVFTESKERGSKKTLENVRNMLKKPMIGGKWF